MNVRVQLFAAARQMVGQEAVVVNVPDGATVSVLRDALRRQYPQLSSILSASLIAVSCQYARDSMPLSSDSEVALIPPVSGG